MIEYECVCVDVREREREREREKERERERERESSQCVLQCPSCEYPLCFHKKASLPSWKKLEQNFLEVKKFEIFLVEDDRLSPYFKFFSLNSTCPS